MKIRIKGNSVRIRLSKPEVAQLAAAGRLEETTEFPNNTFMYVLEAKEGIDGLYADMQGLQVTMYVPAAIASAWAGNDTVGYNNTIELGNGRQLYLLLEKDFKCIDAAVQEDESDNFENPHAACKL